jgi:hypothetical protein
MGKFKAFFLFFRCFVSVSLVNTRNYSVQKSMPSKYQNWNEHDEEIPFRPSKKSKRLLTKRRMFEVPKLPLAQKRVSNILRLKTDQMDYVKIKVFNGLPSKRPNNHVVKKRIGENLSKNSKTSFVFNIPPSKRPNKIVVKKRVFDILPSKRPNLGKAPEQYLMKTRYQKKINHHNRQFLKTMFCIQMERF